MFFGEGGVYRLLVRILERILFGVWRWRWRYLWIVKREMELGSCVLLGFEGG